MNPASNGRLSAANGSRFPFTCALEKRLESIGSRVNATKSDMRVAPAIVSPNWRKNCPTMPLMNATGTKTATTVIVVAKTLSAISLVPSSAACIGGTPRSRCFEMFSRTTTASSMRSPIERLSPSSVIMLSEKPSTYITMKVATTLVGRATALMSVERRSSMKRRMTRIAIAPPKTIATSTSRAFSRMKRD